MKKIVKSILLSFFSLLICSCFNNKGSKSTTDSKETKFTTDYMKWDKTEFIALDSVKITPHYHSDEIFLYSYLRNHKAGMLVFVNEKKDNKTYTIVNESNNVVSNIELKEKKPLLEIGSGNNVICFSDNSSNEYIYNIKTGKRREYKINNFYTHTLTPINDSVYLAYGSLKLEKEKTYALSILKIDVYNSKILENIYTIVKGDKAHPNLHFNGRFYSYDNDIIFTIDGKSLSLLFDEQGNLIKEIHLLPKYDFAKTRKTNGYIQFAFVRKDTLFYITKIVSDSKDKTIRKQVIDKYDKNTGKYISSTTMERKKGVLNYSYVKDTLYSYYNVFGYYEDDDFLIYKSKYVYKE